jgi:hypothetical protein
MAASDEVCPAGVARPLCSVNRGVVQSAVGQKVPAEVTVPGAVVHHHCPRPASLRPAARVDQLGSRTESDWRWARGAERSGAGTYSSRSRNQRRQLATCCSPNSSAWAADRRKRNPGGRLCHTLLTTASSGACGRSAPECAPHISAARAQAANQVLAVMPRRGQVAYSLTTLPTVGSCWRPSSLLLKSQHASLEGT